MLETSNESIRLFCLGMAQPNFIQCTLSTPSVSLLVLTYIWSNVSLLTPLLLLFGLSALWGNDFFHVPTKMGPAWLSSSL